MKTLLRRAFKALAFLVAAAGLAAQADAQLVTYQFTGTKIYGYGDVGTTISGTVTLDVGATPDYSSPYSYSWDDRPNWDYYGNSTGFDQHWLNGGFSIDAVTDSGLASGTFLGGTTVFHEWEQDYQYHYYGTDYSSQTSGSYIQNYEYSGTSERVVYVYGYNNAIGDLVPGAVPNPWDPTGKDYSVIYIYDYNYFSGMYQYGQFTIDSFILVPTTIIIDGIDTGIDDFEYDGQLVSQHLADCAAAVKNHGDYVSRVAKLTNALKKAGLLTGNQKGIIMDAAAQSSYGK